eukprot:gene9463-biopygen4605
MNRRIIILHKGYLIHHVDRPTGAAKHSGAGSSGKDVTANGEQQQQLAQAARPCRHSGALGAGQLSAPYKPNIPTLVGTDIQWHGTAQHGTARRGTARHGMAWYGMVWYNCIYRTV